MPHFEELKNIAQTYLPAEQIEVIENAYVVAKKAHEGQFRSSGEEYITHPVSVSIILAKMHLDYETLSAAILHDVLEDTPVTYDELKAQFGAAITELVDGVSKLDKLKFRDRKEAQVENFRKMLIAMVQDVRVIFIKLADRTHNMQTLDSLREDKKRRIAKETLEIYAPLANRLGINGLKTALEELSFQALHPQRYAIIKKAIKVARRHRKQLIGEVLTEMKERLSRFNIDCEISAQERSVYAIYLKMKRKDQRFQSIMDIYSFRIEVENVDSCYRVLGQIHNLYKPRIGRFKDYIAIPKANGYQALHTSMIGPHGVPLEMYIMTREMAELADFGIITTWIQKSHNQNVNSAAKIKIEHWLKSLIELQQSAGNTFEFIESVKSDLFPRHIYVFTPKGRIVELPFGATVIDLAYEVHTDVGNHAVSAKINQLPASLSQPLTNGQTVEIMTSENAEPNERWINFAATPKAKSKIKQTLKRLRKTGSVILGKQLLEQQLTPYNYQFNSLPEIDQTALLSTLNLSSETELFYLIGSANLSSQTVIAQLQKFLPDLHKKSHAVYPPILVRGNLLGQTLLSSCCYPIPGDEIIAYLEPEHGLIVHRKTRAHHIDTTTHQLIPVDWSISPLSNQVFIANISVVFLNNQETFPHLITTIKLQDVKIYSVNKQAIDARTYNANLKITVKNKQHLDNILNKIELLPNIIQVNRPVES